jgi:hypothetical protein
MEHPFFHELLRGGSSGGAGGSGSGSGDGTESSGAASAVLTTSQGEKK